MTLESAFSSYELWAAALGLVFLAEVVYVALGFGAGMIALGGLVLFTGDPQSAVVILLVVTAPVQIWVILRERQFDTSFLPLMIGIAIGVPLGTYVLRSFEPRVLLLTVGVILVLAAVSVMFKTSAGKRIRWLEGPIGILSGTLSGGFGTGGSPLILYFQWVGLARSKFRSATMTMFFVATLARIPSYAAAGLFQPPRLVAAFTLVPAVIAGILVGQQVHSRLPEPVFRRIVLVVLAGLGLTLILRNA
ncbi:MAG: sulfite exporter TauE/SafE family protein [Myxococcota bacterium]